LRIPFQNYDEDYSNTMLWLIFPFLRKNKHNNKHKHKNNKKNKLKNKNRYKDTAGSRKMLSEIIKKRARDEEEGNSHDFQQTQPSENLNELVNKVKRRSENLANNKKRKLNNNNE